MEVSRALLSVAVTVTWVAEASSAMVEGATESVMLSGSPMVTTVSLTVAPVAVPERMTLSFPSSRSSGQTVKVSVSDAVDSPGSMRRTWLLSLKAWIV